ncbi:MAG: LAGLIDADG family homing endonuclease [Candidatus Nealsonbacteria bacterium]
MARRWTIEEELEKRIELLNFYVRENMAIGEIGQFLGIAESSVFDRMKRLNILSTPRKKNHYCNKRKDFVIPLLSGELAEFVGILLGDGHISDGQIWISVYKKENDYLEYLLNLIKVLFKLDAKYTNCEDRSTFNIYIGSVDLVRFFRKMGLVSNKVKEQVDIPKWIFRKDNYKKSFLKGFFDTDGSIYSLRFGIQMSFCNHSFPLLQSVRELLLSLLYHPSKITGYNLYLTRKNDLKRYAKEIGFGNKKHLEKAKKFAIIFN